MFAVKQRSRSILIPNAIGKLNQVQKQQAEQIIKKLVEVNRYWLIGPSSEVHNYSYEFELLSSPKVVTYDVNNPTTARWAVRQGICYYSLLNYAALHPEDVSITDFVEKDSIIQLTVSLIKPVKMHCGNGIEKTYFGSFSRPMQGGTIWIDPNRMVPLKANVGTVREQYGDYMLVEENLWVPLNIKVDADYMHFDFKFNFFKPGLWLFDTSEYRIDKTEYKEASEHPKTASIRNVKINGILSKDLSDN